MVRASRRRSQAIQWFETGVVVKTVHERHNPYARPAWPRGCRLCIAGACVARPGCLALAGRRAFGGAVACWIAQRRGAFGGDCLSNAARMENLLANPR